MISQGLINGGISVTENGGILKEVKEKKHNHYFIDVSGYDEIDIYRITELYECNNMAHHIVKKALCAGNRGHKDLKTDLHNIIDTANRWLKMIEEDQQNDRTT